MNTLSRYPGAVDVWVRNWSHVEQLFNYGSVVRKVMYTTNAMEAVRSSFHKVTKKTHSPAKMPSEKPCICGLQNSIKNGMGVRYRTGHWQGISLPWMIKYRAGF